MYITMGGIYVYIYITFSAVFSVEEVLMEIEDGIDSFVG